MSIEVLNESGHDLDVKQLAALSRFVLDRMRVHPLAELCIKAVDEETIAELNAAVDGEGRARPTCSPSRWTSCGPAWSTRSPRRACSVTSCSARRSPSGRARPPATAPTRRSSC